MHEMSLAEGVLAIIEEQAAKSGFARVKAVWLEIGALSGVETEAMRFSECRCARGVASSSLESVTSRRCRL